MNTTAITTKSTNYVILRPVPDTLSDNCTSNVIDVFLSYQDINHNSPNTYKRALRQFFLWVVNTGRSVDNLTRADVLQWRQDMRDRQLSPNTINSYLTALRRFYDFCEQYKIAPNIANRIKSEKTTSNEEHEKSDFTATQTNNILQATIDAGNKRDVAIMALMFFCGLRTVEVVRANIGDITLYGDTYILTVHGKGDKRRRVPITPKAWQAVNNYLSNERKGAKDNEPLFASNGHQCKGGRMATASISRMAKKYIRAVGINDSKHTAHSCRHTTAGLIYGQTHELDRIQQLLGHSDPATTQIYAKQAMQADFFNNAPNLAIDNLIVAM